MALLLVTCDVKAPEKRQRSIRTALDRYSSLRLSDTTFAVITDKTPDNICEEMKTAVGKDDTVCVISLKRPYEVNGSRTIDDWLNKTLTD